MSRPASRFPLPIELLLRILAELQVADLLKCKLVSHHFNKAIASSAQLRYAIELAVASYVDIDTPRSFSTAEKLGKLRISQNNWSHLNYSRLAIPIPKSTMFDYNGGAYASSNNADRGPGGPNPITSSKINFIRLPSRACNGPDVYAKSELVVNDTFTDFNFDTSQDLLILVQARAESMVDVGGATYYSEFRILFRTISTAGHHPEARESHVVYKPTTATTDDVVLLIVEHRVIVQIGDRLNIWDWKTGRLVGVVPDRIDTYAMLDFNCILTMNNQRGDLDIFTLPRDGGAGDSETLSRNRTQCPLVATFNLPHVRRPWTINSVNCWSHPPPASQGLTEYRRGDSVTEVNPNGPDNYQSNDPEASSETPTHLLPPKPFKPDPSRCILTITINYIRDDGWEEDPQNECDLAFLVPNSTFLRFLPGEVHSDYIRPHHTPSASGASGLSDGDSRAQVPWSEWSPYARCFLAPPCRGYPEWTPRPELINILSTPLWHWHAYGLRAAILVLDKTSAVTAKADQQSRSPQRTPNFRLRVVDFNQVVIRREEGAGPVVQGSLRSMELSLHRDDNPEAMLAVSQSILVTEPDCIEEPDLFTKPLVCGSALPYRCTLSEETFPGLNGVLLDDERVLGMQILDWSDAQARPLAEIVVLEM